MRSKRDASALAVWETADLATTCDGEQGASVANGDDSVASEAIESVAVADVVGTPGAASLGRSDVFIAAKANRRVRLPAWLRQGRHRAMGRRHAAEVTEDRAETPALDHG